MPPQQQDKVWISREEYERLRQVAQPLPPVYGMPGQMVADKPAHIRPVQVAIGILLAIGLYLSMTSSLFRFIAMPVVVLLIIFAAMSIADLRRSHNPLLAQADAAVGQKAARRKYKTLLTVLICVLAVPVLYIGVIIVLFLTVASQGGGF